MGNASVPLRVLGEWEGMFGGGAGERRGRCRPAVAFACHAVGVEMEWPVQSWENVALVQGTADLEALSTIISLLHRLGTRDVQTQSRK